ncbi:DUF982 domain-containing protein [Mesorhizobium atlanticum]
MNDVWFSEPVVIDLQPNGQRKVSTCFEAMECLDQRWPGQARDGGLMLGEPRLPRRA